MPETPPKLNSRLAIPHVLQKPINLEDDLPDLSKGASEKSMHMKTPGAATKRTPKHVPAAQDIPKRDFHSPRKPKPIGMCKRERQRSPLAPTAAMIAKPLLAKSKKRHLADAAKEQLLTEMRAEETRQALMQAKNNDNALISNEKIKQHPPGQPIKPPRGQTIEQPIEKHRLVLELEESAQLATSHHNAAILSRLNDTHNTLRKKQLDLYSAASPHITAHEDTLTALTTPLGITKLQIRDKDSQGEEWRVVTFAERLSEFAEANGIKLKTLKELMKRYSEVERHIEGIKWSVVGRAEDGSKVDSGYAAEVERMEKEYECRRRELLNGFEVKKEDLRAKVEKMDRYYQEKCEKKRKEGTRRMTDLVNFCRNDDEGRSSQAGLEP